MQRDGGLYALFRSHFPNWLWCRLETGDICPGIPDAMFCAPGGKIGLIEFKQTSGYKITFQTTQVPFIHKWDRFGGNVFVAIRRKKDELFVVSGEHIVELADKGVKGFSPVSGTGARNWDWSEVEEILLEKKSSVNSGESVKNG